MWSFSNTELLCWKDVRVHKWWQKFWVNYPFNWKLLSWPKPTAHCVTNDTCKSVCTWWHLFILYSFVSSDHSQKSFWCRTGTHFICLADLWPCLITCIHSDYSFLISRYKQELTGREIFRTGAQIKTYPVIISHCLKCNYCIDLSWYILISLESSVLFELKQWTHYCFGAHETYHVLFYHLQMVSAIIMEQVSIPKMSGLSTVIALWIISQCSDVSLAVGLLHKYISLKPAILFL